MIKKSVIIALLALSLVRCTPDDEAYINVQALLQGFGLYSDFFEVSPSERFGTLVFYQSPRVVERMAEQLEYKGETTYIIQIQGALAQQIIQQKAYFSNGTIRFDTEGVVFLFGDIADGVYRKIRNIFTIDDIYYFEGKEIVVFGGLEALTIMQLASQKAYEYLLNIPEKIERISIISYESTINYVSDVAYTFYDDLGLVFATNPLCVGPLEKTRQIVKVPADVAALSFEAIQGVTLLPGYIWVMAFDSVSRLAAYVTLSERVPFSVMLKKSVKLVGELGYMAAYTVSEAFHVASESDVKGHDELRGMVIHPWLVFDVTSVTLTNLTKTADLVVEGAAEILVGFFSDNVALLGEFLNLFDERKFGSILILIGSSTASSIRLGGSFVKAIVRFGGNGLSAVVGLLSFTKPWDQKFFELKQVFIDFRNDFRASWHAILRFMGWR